MEKIEWKVEGMDCTNCALSITKYLQKEGMKDVKVNFIGGDVNFELNGGKSKEELSKGIADLGYKVANDGQQTTDNNVSSSAWSSIVRGQWSFSNHLQRFLFCLPFTLVLMLHMLPWHIHFLMNPWMQLAICIPVYIVGMGYFGVSAVKSLRRGIPNMNVLIAIGATAAFVYSLIGTLGNFGMDFIFYETTATIITLVFLGEWIEHKSVAGTQKELNKLAAQQKIMANMIAFDDEHKELIFVVENTKLHVGDLIEHSAVALVADTRQHRHIKLTDAPGELVVIEPGQIVHGSASADDGHGIGDLAPRCLQCVQRLKQSSANLRRGALPLEPAVDVHEGADAEPFEPLGFSLEVTESSTTLRRDNEHDVVVPGLRQLAVGVKEALSLKPGANLALLGLEVPERVFRVNGINFEAEAELGLEHRPCSHQEFDSRRYLGASCTLELRKDAGGRGRPYHGICLGEDTAAGVALRHLDVDVAVTKASVNHLDHRPDASLKRLGYRLGHTSKELGEGGTPFLNGELGASGFRPHRHGGSR